MIKILGFKHFMSRKELWISSSAVLSFYRLGECIPEETSELPKAPEAVKGPKAP